MTHSIRRTTAAALVACTAVTTLATLSSPATAGATPDALAPASQQVSAAEQRAVGRLDPERIAKISKAADLPAQRQAPAARLDKPGGPPVTFKGTARNDGATATTAATSSTTTSASVATTSVSGNLWPGAYNANPNKQIGKLYFDKDPSAGVSWSHCTATAINSENKSLVLTAGHCVYDFANRRWYTQMFFYPGYQNGTHLGQWTVRLKSTTGNYFNYGASADDMAIVLVNRDAAGVPLVTRQGGHGIAFNQPVNQTRTSFGYPITDSRWPGFTASGEDMYYCQGVDAYYSSGSFAGQHQLACRMTGGASGGPWLSNVNSAWLGTATTVNSNKGGIGSSWANYMFAPYMGAQEQAVFQAYRAG